VQVAAGLRLALGRSRLLSHAPLRGNARRLDAALLSSPAPVCPGPHLTGAGQLHRRRCLPPWGAAVIVASAGRRAEVEPRRAVGNVSDTRTSPTPIDRPALVRPISEIALIASVEEGSPAPDRQPVPVTQLDLCGRRSARRLPCARRPPNAEAAHWNAGWAMRISRSDAAAIRLVTRHGSVRGFVSDSL